MSTAVLDLEMMLRRSGATPFRTAVRSPALALCAIHEYLACCWGIPLPRDVNAATIQQALTAKGEYRRDVDHEGFRIVLKKAS